MIMEEKQLSDRTQQDKQINRKINKIINFCEALWLNGTVPMLLTNLQKHNSITQKFAKTR